MDQSVSSEINHLKLEKLNYNSYLKLDTLLSLQQVLSDPAHHDEMFFIVIHQAAELWFKEILHETEALIQAFSTHSVSRALKVLRRVTAIMDLQVKQINLLATLTPVEFAGFRDHLRPASGFQSLQFRLIEFAYGLRDDFFIRFFEKDPEAFRALEVWKNRPSVHQALIEYAAKYAPAGRKTGAVGSDSGLNLNFLNQVSEIYESPGENYHWVLLCEALLDFDERFALWRSTHILMVNRTIGKKSGTGGSSGVDFLQSRVEYRFFPELWAVRSSIGMDAPVGSCPHLRQ
jgi:tryptophan 2,3-dioxygenase